MAESPLYLCEALRGPRWGFRQSGTVQVIRPSGAHVWCCGAPLRRSGGGCGLLGTSAQIRLGWAPRRRSGGGCGCGYRSALINGGVFRRCAVVSRVRAESSAAPPRTSSPEAKESLWHARNIAAVRQARRQPGIVSALGACFGRGLFVSCKQKNVRAARRNEYDSPGDFDT